MKMFFPLIILLFVINCTKETLIITNSNVTTNKASEIKYGKKFFDYDEIDSYHIETEGYEIKSLYKNRDKSEIEKFKYDVVLDETPKNIKNIDFLKYMDKIGYSKKKIDSSQFKKIDEVLVEKTEDQGDVSACIPVFRDILVFKKDRKVIGVIKICFDCHQYRIIGTNVNIKNFGSDNDYEILRNILENYK